MIGVCILLGALLAVTWGALFVMWRAWRRAMRELPKDSAEGVAVFLDYCNIARLVGPCYLVCDGYSWTAVDARPLAIEYELDARELH